VRYILPLPPGEGWYEGPETLFTQGLWRAEQFCKAFDLHPIAKLLFQDRLHFKNALERPDHKIPLRIDVLLVERGVKLYRPEWPLV
jgi:hypothetical protein